MEYSIFNKQAKKELVLLFTRTFSESEGSSEGEIVGQLVQELIENTEPRDLLGYIATENTRIIAGIFFSRLRFQKPIEVFMLSPVAVHTEYQGRGIGQQLINYGLEQLKDKNVELVFTYGDPKYYAKVGFERVPENRAKAPFDLSQPNGWLWQPLTDRIEELLLGTCRCVAAFSHPEYW